MAFVEAAKLFTLSAQFGTITLSGNHFRAPEGGFGIGVTNQTRARVSWPFRFTIRKMVVQPSTDDGGGNTLTNISTMHLEDNGTTVLNLQIPAGNNDTQTSPDVSVVIIAGRTIDFRFNAPTILAGQSITPLVHVICEPAE